VVRTTTAVAQAIQASGEHRHEYAEQRREWRERFVAHDDGHAAENVVRRMLEEGWLNEE
jgi:CDP-glycerol glycerophosphotransferase